jgi:hypothetical protein
MGIVEMAPRNAARKEREMSKPHKRPNGPEPGPRAEFLLRLAVRLTDAEMRVQREECGAAQALVDELEEKLAPAKARLLELKRALATGEVLSPVRCVILSEGGRVLRARRLDSGAEFELCAWSAPCELAEREVRR